MGGRAQVAADVVEHEIRTRRFVSESRHLAEEERIAQTICDLLDLVGPFHAEHTVTRPLVACAGVLAVGIGECGGGRPS